MKVHFSTFALTIPFVLALLLIAACDDKSKTEKEETAAAEKTTTATEEPAGVAPTEEEIRTLISCIPDHGMDNAYSWAFTEEYYDLLKRAWDKPVSEDEGYLGENEFLYYFINGNGEPYSRIDLDSTYTVGDKAVVSFDCVWVWEHEEMNRMSHKLYLTTTEEGKWVIENYDDTKALMEEYLSE